MKYPVRTNGTTKLLVFSLLAVAANVPASGASAAEPPVKATCSAPDHIAALKSASDPAYPAIAKAEGISGSTLVRVSLNSSGAVKKAIVAQSSGFAVLDSEALASARTSAYDPETVSCRPVAGTYFVNVTFAE
jgi:protein TonB